MDGAQHNKIVSFIWGIADDVLRDLYVRASHSDSKIGVRQHASHRLAPDGPCSMRAVVAYYVDLLQFPEQTDEKHQSRESVGLRVLIGSHGGGRLGGG